MTEELILGVILHTVKEDKDFRRKLLHALLSRCFINRPSRMKCDGSFEETLTIVDEDGETLFSE